MQPAASVHNLTAKRAARAPRTAARLSISLVGRLAVRLNGRPVELRTQKAGAVLGYLALTETKGESRERLVGLFWSRSDEGKARASLRQVVRELRAAFADCGYSGFVAGRLSVHFDADLVDVDVESIIRLAENGSVHPLLLNTPQLDERTLEGLDDLDPSFRVWVLAKRQTIHDRLMRILGAGLVAEHVAAGAKHDIARAIANLDPTHEEACCHLMRMHAEQGDVAGALRLYKALWNLLDRDYGMEPSPATEALVAKIKLGGFEQYVCRPAAAPAERAIPPLAAAPRASAKTWLVLLPFAMHGIDGDHAHLVQGFQQHLAASLVRFREWSVVDGHPANLFRQWSGADGSSTIVAPAAAETVLQYSIETTAYRADTEINMVMVLKDDRTGIYVGSESFRLGLGNWFDAQQRVIRRIAMSLNVQLSAERLMRLAGEPDVSLDMHDRWLRGQNLMLRFDPESWGRARTIFLDAIRENPTFSPFYSSLVQMNNIEHFVHPGLFRDRDKAKATLDLAKTAVQLDPIDSRAHLCCGWAHVMAQREAEAGPHINLACELNDNDPWTLLSSAAYCAFCESTNIAHTRARQALRLSLAPSCLEWGYHGIIRFLCGDYAGALKAIDRAQGVIKTLPAWRAATLFALGQPDQARQEAQRFLNGIRSCWVGSASADDVAIARWLMQAHPIRIRSRWEALHHLLRGAGLPVE